MGDCGRLIRRGQNGMTAQLENKAKTSQHALLVIDDEHGPAGRLLYEDHEDWRCSSQSGACLNLLIPKTA